MGVTSIKKEDWQRQILIFWMLHRKVAAHTLQSKMEDRHTLKYIPNFGVWLERITADNVLLIHTDNAKESIGIKRNISELGVKLTSTSAYSPESNKVTERMSKTLLRKLEALFSNIRKSQRVLEEAPHHAIYLRNRTATGFFKWKRLMKRFWNGARELTKMDIWMCRICIFSSLTMKNNARRQLHYGEKHQIDKQFIPRLHSTTDAIYPNQSYGIPQNNSSSWEQWTN